LKVNKKDYKSSDPNYRNAVMGAHPAKTASDEDVCKMRLVSKFWMNESRSRGLNCNN
jgi:hypothetical protein